MASTWSNAELRLMTTGENDNTWGDQTNDNIKRLDDMVNQVIAVTLSGATETLTFTSKLSLTKYLDRLRKNLYKTDIPLCIVDTIRNITTKFNLTELTSEVAQKLNHQQKRSDKLRFIPKTMVKVEKSSKDIRKDRIKDILRDIRFGDLNQAKHKLDKYFDK